MTQLKQMLLLIVCSSLLFGASSSAIGQPGIHDPRAIEILQSSRDYFSELASCKVDLESRFITEVKNGRVFEQDSTQRIAWAKPDRFTLSAPSNSLRRTIIDMFDRNQMGWMPLNIVSNGVSLFISDGRTCYVEASPKDHVQLIDDLWMQQVSWPGGFLLSMLAGPTPFNHWEDHVPRATHRGIVEVDGVKSHHVQLHGWPGYPDGEGPSMHLWIAAEGPPIPLRWRANYMGSPRMENNILFFAGYVEVRFKNWSVDDEVDKQVFTFQPRQGVDRRKLNIQFDTRILEHGYIDHAVVSAEIGELLPRVRLAMLGGGKHDTVGVIGKQPAVLYYVNDWRDAAGASDILEQINAKRMKGQLPQFALYLVVHNPGVNKERFPFDAEALPGVRVLYDPGFALTPSRFRKIGPYEAFEVIDRQGKVRSRLIGGPGQTPFWRWRVLKAVDSILER